MGAHALIAPIPVDFCDDARARGGKGRAHGRRVQNRLPIGVIARIDDRDRLAVVEDQRALVAGLAAALRIEDGPIERDSAHVRGEHFRLGLAQIGIVAEQGFGHRTKTSGARPCASSQAGTGRFLERRKAGLKSFEA